MATSVRAVERTESSVTGGAASGTPTFSPTARGPRLRLDQLVHHGQPGERVLAVEDSRLVDLVGLLALGVQGAASEVAVDRRTADQDGVLEAALVELAHAGRHLLGGRDQQRRQADRRGV